MMKTTPDSATDLLVRGLRLGVHIAFGALLAVGLVKTALDGQLGPVTLLLAAALAAVYVSGTAFERRLALRAGYGRRPEISPGLWGPWLAAVLLLWALLVLRQPEFAYCAFPLFFVILHLLRPLWLGALGLVAVLAVLVFSFVSSGTTGAGAVIGPVIGAAFSVMVFIVYEALVRDSLEQRRALAELEAARSELAVAHHAAGVAAERDRFSAEIHDTLAQGLNAIVLTARAGLAADAQPRQSLETILELASANLAEARDIVRGSAAIAPAGRDADLMPEITAALERIGITLGEPAGQDGVVVDLRDERSPQARSASLTPAARRLVVLAASSLVSNVLRHAGAQRAVVTLEAPDASQLTVDVVDDGAGFTPSRAAEGFGLSSLRERAERLGGRLLVESAPGDGTAVSLQIPLAAGKETQS